MSASLLRFAAGCMLTLAALSGCSTTISTKVPNWPQSPGKSAEETREIREAEIARYRTSPEQMSTKMLMSNVMGDQGKTTPAPEGMPARPAAVAAGQQPPTSFAPSAKEVKLGNWEAQKSEKPAVVASTVPPRAANKPAGSPATQSSRYGDLVFISGQLPVDARGQPVAADTRIEDQIRLALDNVRWALEAQRLSMANVVSMTVFLRDLNDSGTFDKVYESYTRGGEPARTVVEVARLPHNARVEISAVAGR